MNRLAIILCILTISNSSNSQTKALAENGREVLLYDNGTWKYSSDNGDQNSMTIDSLTTNPNKFIKSSGANFLVKSTVFNIGVFVDPTKWIVASHKDNEKNPEFRFTLKSGEGYGMMMTEKTEITLESMREIALINAKNASSDVKETSAEYRIVNNKKILCLKLQGTIKGIKFVYFGYYYTNANGTVQLITYSSQQFFDGIKPELEKFLNGIVEIEK